MHRVFACQHMSQDIEAINLQCTLFNIGIILHSSPPPTLPSLAKRRNYILSVGSSYCAQFSSGKGGSGGGGGHDQMLTYIFLFLVRMQKNRE
ncbi:hypothetical protein POVCU2_0094180 [Plasmodium ovale curtisi]|uniref:Uncharacterized protein n=1 Tax=Plasmodium ovale curtisi TaxID=864141 RepID=A0A1A8WTP9_PLAOA|nr:hypothetical protein POVCU1_028920 [Plasmodium ovale curtisi]SBS95228.1 hypothetical protein POVCU2_0094180 [Plasmodium ovale curtisi]